VLTAAQRLHFDVHGYVLLKSVLPPAECEQLVDIARRMKADSPYVRHHHEHQTVLYGPAWYADGVLALAMDPRLRTPAEQIVGGETRLEENEFIIFHPPSPPRQRPAAAAPPDAALWHRGMKPGPGSFEAEGHYHCLFAKTLIYLTDNGPAAGTWIVPGSHRMPYEVADIMRVADASLVRQVLPEPGDVLLFGETLVHCSPRPAFDRDRLLLVIGYCAPYMSPWGVESDPPPDFASGLSAEQRRFVYGESRYQVGR